MLPVPAGAAFPVALPNDPGLVGTPITAQMIASWPSAPLGLAVSSGLHLNLGL